MQITITSNPSEIYSVASITANTIIDVQNKTSGFVHIFAGDAQPGSSDDYFILEPWAIKRMQGAVCYAWSPSDAEIMVQEV